MRQATFRIQKLISLIITLKQHSDLYQFQIMKNSKAVRKVLSSKTERIRPTTEKTIAVKYD